MEEAAVIFLLNNLKELLAYRTHLITDTNKQIESLQTDLSFFKAFLKDYQRRQTKDERTKELFRNIRDVVYEVEDVIDALVTQTLENKFFGRPPVDLHTIGRKVEEVRLKVEGAKIDLLNLKVNEEEKSEARPPRLKDVVGFADVTEELIHHLTEESDYLDVVGLIGRPGLGKTTLAWKIFNDPAIHYEFPVRIWLSLSQEFSEKDIFLAILKEFTTITHDIRQKDKDSLAQLVSAYLETKGFLIVMDDIWSCADWDRLRCALPTDNNRGKVLITSRIDEVGRYACNRRPPHYLRLFSEDESWELLRLEALRTLECPLELQPVGKLIASRCKGLPLALVVIGGILATKYSTLDLNATEIAWRSVYGQLVNYRNNEEADMNTIISLSYDKLPCHSRECFLYLSIFPEDYEIPKSKLIRLWIAEGFIQQRNDSSLEETAEKYLEDLINRNLVITSRIKPSGKVKTCRIHDVLRDFCRNEARNEDFLQEIKCSNSVFSPPVSDLHKCRRLSIHSDCPKFFSLRPVCPRVRSFVCFSKDKLILQPENIPDIFKAFKLLRVLDVSCIKFPRISRDLFCLFHLRYIALMFDWSILPSKLNLLWNLQTLIVYTTNPTLEVKADICKFIGLRLFKTNVSTTLPKPSKDSENGTDLQTLGTISVESCTTELFQRACNLKKLGIRGQLALLLEGKKGSFDSLGKMENLENLKLINDVHPRAASEGQLNGLPPPHLFPCKLKSLTLRATYLDWSNMSILGLLVNLEVLKLKDKAFMGKTWVAVDEGFPRLEVLLIEDADLEVWAASSHHFPKLRALVLRSCEKLLGVPAKLAEINTFQMLELYTCKYAVPSAKKVQEAKIKAQATFKLSIFPPTD